MRKINGWPVEKKLELARNVREFDKAKGKVKSKKYYTTRFYLGNYDGIGEFFDFKISAEEIKRRKEESNKKRNAVIPPVQSSFNFAVDNEDEVIDELAELIEDTARKLGKRFDAFMGLLSVHQWQKIK